VKVMMDPLIDPGEYAALASCTYLNQASLGLIPRTSVAASVRFLTEVAQHGNLRLSDQAEARVLDGLRTAAAELLGAPVPSVAVVGGASEGLGQLAALLSTAGGEAVLVASDFPSVTYPWLAARERLGMRALASQHHINTSSPRAASGYPCTPTTAATTSTPSPKRSPPSACARPPALSV
jgi:kynureninase